jgi:uncharacterized Ntn-hydrolase superfamily protein
MTYSIVARDPETGALGVGVQTCMFAVGAIVPWARAGVGAVATQAFSERAYGWRCLEAMADGRSAEQALAAARAADGAAAMRQVGVVDSTGSTAAFTGELCVDHAGDQLGSGFAVQANMMASPDVWPAMAGAFESAQGLLAERLLAALVAGEAAGGDARGRMSAALLVVDGERRDDATDGVLVDLRVDAHDEPLGELARLLRASDAFRHYFRAVDAIGAGDNAAVSREIGAALTLLPDDENLLFVRAGSLFFDGRIDEGRAALDELLGRRPTWSTIIRSFVDKGMISLPPGVDIAELLGSEVAPD